MILNRSEWIAALNLDHGLENSLDVKLESVIRTLEVVKENNGIAAINSLKALINCTDSDHASPGSCDLPVPPLNALTAKKERPRRRNP